MLQVYTFMYMSVNKFAKSKTVINDHSGLNQLMVAKQRWISYRNHRCNKPLLAGE